MFVYHFENGGITIMFVYHLENGATVLGARYEKVDLRLWNEKAREERVFGSPCTAERCQF